MIESKDEILAKINLLKQRKQEILNRNAYWKSSTDGSYECALANSGYDAVCDEIDELNKKLGEF